MVQDCPGHKWFSIRWWAQFEVPVLPSWLVLSKRPRPTLEGHALLVAPISL